MSNSAVGKNCPYCQFPIKNESEVKWCPVCKMPHHIDCWKENTGCTTFACTGVINSGSFDELKIDFGVTNEQEQWHLEKEQWYLSRRGNTSGPFSWEQLNELKDIRPDDMLSCKNYKNWIKAEQVISTFNPTDNYDSNIHGSKHSYANLDIQHAGFWMRSAAFIFDIIVFLVCLLIIDSLVPGVGDSSLFVIFIQWMYYSLFEISSLQATPGKLAIGLQVTDLYGEKINFGKATGRYFGRLLSSLILGIGYFMAGFTREKQTLHDILAGCYVIKR